ncbi:MAG: helix-turn-helix transcriptional regulator [Clostridia bacterium]|nr:helix-turn-helix transcriptional regulator [Clostridia bacterium]
MKIQIADNIKRFRIASGYTQSDLAVLLSVSPQAVSRWENGQAFPDITFLPLLAKYLKVSIDELMGIKGQQNESLKKELRERRQAVIDDDSEKLQNELRILEIYEELGHAELFYLIDYFKQLMLVKNNAVVKIKDLEDRIANARQMIRDRLRTSGMCDRIWLLNTVASCEEEDKLAIWADEYEFPEYMRTNFWDKLLLSRYDKEKNTYKLNAQNQKILYEHIQNTIYYLTDSVSGDMKEQMNDFHDPERYKMALDTLDLYSTRADDIFLTTRIIAEVRYAEALLINGCTEESLAMFSQAGKHLLLLYHLPDGSVLHGSVPVLSTVHIAIDYSKDKLEKCVFNLNTYDKNPQFDQIREDKRFVAYMESRAKFLPHNCKSWVDEIGNDMVDTRWKMLLNRAKKETETLSDGNVVVMLTINGAVDAISFQNLNSVIEAEGAMKFLIEKKKNGDARIERLICMWHDGSIDLPSFAFREALLSVENANVSTQMLLNGIKGYVVKTVKATMPKGYKT